MSHKEKEKLQFSGLTSNIAYYHYYRQIKCGDKTHTKETLNNAVLKFLDEADYNFCFPIFSLRNCKGYLFTESNTTFLHYFAFYTGPKRLWINRSC